MARSIENAQESYLSGDEFIPKQDHTKLNFQSPEEQELLAASIANVAHKTPETQARLEAAEVAADKALAARYDLSAE